MSSFEIVNQGDEGVEVQELGWPARLSHLALIDVLRWRKGPLSMRVGEQLSCFDMFWLSCERTQVFREIVNVLRTDVLDIQLREFDAQILHVGPVFTSLYWATSRFQEIKAGRVIVDLPLFGATLRYVPGLAYEEALNRYRRVRKFAQDTLRKLGFVGAIFWGVLDDVVIGSNMFYFAKEKIVVNAEAEYEGNSIDKTLFDELPELTDNEKPKRIEVQTFPGRRTIRYQTSKMKLRFGIYDDESHVRETSEIPFVEFKMSLRPDLFLFIHDAPESSTT